MESTGSEPEDFETAPLDGPVDSEGAAPAAGQPDAENAVPATDLDPEDAAAAAELDPEDAAGTAQLDGEASDLIPVRPRSAPRYGSFIGVGVIFGVVLALILFYALPSDGSTSAWTGLVYLMILITPFTALLGGLAAVIFERRSLRK